jgi:imidazolonepropionase
LSEFIFLRGARQLLTLRGPESPRRGAHLQDLGLIEDGSLLLRGEQIYAVGSTRRIENMRETRDALEVSAAGQIILPGFVDVDLNLSRPPEPAALSDRSKSRKLQKLYEGSLELMRSCLQHGTVTADVKASARSSDFASDVGVMRQLAKIGHNPVHMRRTWQVQRPSLTAAESEDLTRTFEVLARRKLMDGVEVEASEPASDHALNLLARLRENCTREQLDLKLRWHGGPDAHFREHLAAAKPDALHCSSHLVSEDVEICARWNKTVVFSPGSELSHSSGKAARQLIDAGLAVALGSGYDALRTPGFSMQMAISLAILRAELTPEEAITAGTINAAYAAGYGAVAGSLQVGKRANLLVLTVPDYREISRQFGVNHVGMVFRDGALVINRGHWKIGAHGASAGRMRS